MQPIKNRTDSEHLSEKETPGPLIWSQTGTIRYLWIDKGEGIKIFSKCVLVKRYGPV
jgi:hypothetical protein